MFWEPGMTLADVEKRAILAAYHFHKKNKTHTAQELDIAIRTLDAKLDRYELDAQEYRLMMEKVAKDSRAKRDALMGEKGEDPFNGPETGFPVEPHAKVSEEQSLSVQERGEVQKVLPQQAAAGSTNAPEAPRARTRAASARN